MEERLEDILLDFQIYLMIQEENSVNSGDQRGKMHKLHKKLNAQIVILLHQPHPRLPFPPLDLPTLLFTANLI